MSSLAVIIPTCDRPQQLWACLNSVLFQVEKKTDHIFIVNDGTPGSVESGFSKIPNVTVIEHCKDYYARASAINVGLAAATGYDYGLILDDDCRLRPKAIHYHRKAWKSGREVNGKVLYVGAIHEAPYDKDLRLAPKYGGLRAALIKYGGTVNLSFPLEAVVKAGAFDEKFDGQWGFEDTELCSRLMIRDGWEVIHVKNAIADHDCKEPANDSYSRKVVGKNRDLYETLIETYRKGMWGPHMRVAVIADVRGWAFDNILKGIIKYNPDPNLQIDVFYETEVRDDQQQMAKIAKYDLIYPFSLFQTDFLWQWGCRDYIGMCHMGPLGTGLPPGQLPDVSSYNQTLYRGAINGRRFGVISKFLADVWRPVRPDVRFLRVGVDPDLFYPLRGERAEGPLRVGWVGNSEKPYKRFDLVKAATDCEGIELCTVDWRRAHGDVLRPYEQMGDFYRSLDVYLCTSDHEGLPTPALEVAGCGVPIVSVPVGAIPELVVDGVTGYIVSQDAQEIQTRLASLRDDRAACQRMGVAMMERISERAWPRVVMDWIDFIKGE